MTIIIFDKKANFENTLTKFIDTHIYFCLVNFTYPVGQFLLVADCNFILKRCRLENDCFVFKVDTKSVTKA